MRALVGLGSNLGDRQAALDQAVALLAEARDVKVLARSRWRETRPAGGPKGQPPFLNGAVVVETRRTPAELFETLMRIEHRLGRTRHRRWGPRTVDLDLLLYEQTVVSSGRMMIPHPRMAWRRFVIEPAAEIAPRMVHPLLGWSMAQLLEHLNASPAYVAITGPSGTHTQGVARAVAEAVGAELVLDEPGSLCEAPWGSEGGRSTESGRFYRAAVESLWRHRRLLAKDHGLWDPRGRYRISDFWFGQTLALAERCSGDQFEAFRLQWHEASCHVVWPRLTVLLAPDVCLPDGRLVPQERGGEAHGTKAELSGGEQVARALAKALSNSGKGPILCPEAGSGPDAVAEIVAAIEAMDG